MYRIISDPLPPATLAKQIRLISYETAITTADADDGQVDDYPRHSTT
jgi:hypothetical protein